MMVSTAYLVDTDTVFKCGLSHLLREKYAVDVVGQSADFATARNTIMTLQPDIVIVDPSHGIFENLHYFRYFRTNDCNSKFFLLCERPSASAMSELRALELQGYALKPWKLSELDALMDAVRNNQIYLSPEFREHANSSAAAGVRTRQCGSSVLTQDLSARETQILVRTVNGKTAAEIAREFEISIKTAEWHRRNVFTKLDVKNIAQLTKYALRAGIIALD